jgi:anti-anti-sigma factor
MLEISQNEVGNGTAVVKLAGKLMLGPEGEQVVSVVEELVSRGTKLIVFDLSELTAIDSTGIGRFISSFNKIMATGGEMRMAGAGGHVLQSFKVSLLDKVFKFYDTVAEAAAGR